MTYIRWNFPQSNPPVIPTVPEQPAQGDGLGWQIIYVQPEENKMDQERFAIIAATLGEFYRRVKRLEYQRDITQTEIDTRRIEITPEGGWPGSNEAARKTAAEQAGYADQALHALNLILRDLQHSLAAFQGEIMALEAERRGMEYQVKWLAAVTAAESAGIAVNVSEE